MSRLSLKLCIAGAVLFCVAAGASVASATWTTNGSASGTAFTGSAAGGARFALTNSTGTASGITCTGATLGGSLLGTAIDGPLLGSLTPAFTSCQVVGQSAKVGCTTTVVDGYSYTAPTATFVTGLSCLVAKTSGACGNTTTLAGGISIKGALLPTYGNTSQLLTLGNTSESMSATWSGAGCLAGTPGSGDNATLLNTSGTSLGYGTTSAFKPQLSCGCTGIQEPANGATLGPGMLVLAIEFVVPAGNPDYKINSVVVNAPMANWHTRPLPGLFPLDVKRDLPRAVSIYKTAGAAATTVTITTTRPAPDDVITYNVN
jgi:hypothetical protein